MISLEDLIATDDPAWPLVQRWLSGARHPVEVLPANRVNREAALHALQVTLRSPLGAVVWHTGGLLIDGGWLRILGSGHPRLTRSVPSWNLGKSFSETGQRPSFLLIADDVLGGFFALNGGALSGSEGTVNYFAPDTLEWESLEVGYSDFLSFACSSGLAEFYSAHRWPGWESEVAAIGGDEGLLVFPFLSAQGGPIEQRSRGTVPISELYDLHIARAN